MEIVKQILNIPKNHQLHFDVTLPDSFPSGPAEVLLVFVSKVTTSRVAANAAAAEVLSLAGSLKNSTNFGGDPLVIQKALRDGWKR